MKRPITLVIASVLEAVSGLLGVIFGAILVIGGAFFGAFLDEIGADFMEQLAFLGVYVLGIIAIIGSVLDLIAAYGLWQLRKWAGYLTIILCSLSIVVSAITFNLFSMIDFVWCGLVIVLVAIGWGKLKPSKRRIRKVAGET